MCNKYCSIDWREIINFSPSEFSENPEKYADPKLIHILQDLRTLYGNSIYPSPASGALARHNGSVSSQHYVGDKNKISRKSTAIDVFPKGIPFNFYMSIIKIQTIHGIGIYMDTDGPDGHPWVMFHLDIRKKGFSKDIPLIWIVKKVKGKSRYFYPQSELSKWMLLSDDKFFTYRRKNR